MTLTHTQISAIIGHQYPSCGRVFGVYILRVCVYNHILGSEGVTGCVRNLY